MDFTGSQVKKLPYNKGVDRMQNEKDFQNQRLEKSIMNTKLLGGCKLPN